MVTGLTISKKLIAVLIVVCVSAGMIPRSEALTTTRGSSSTANPGDQEQLQMKNHSCCPRMQPRVNLPVPAAFNHESVPCSEHPCCISRAPGSPSGLPAASGLHDPVRGKVFHEKIDVGAQQRFAGKAERETSIQPSSSLNLVLRI